MSVSAAATNPPVQDSAIPTSQRRARQVSSTRAANAPTLSPGKQMAPDQVDDHGVDRLAGIVEHDAPAAGQIALEPPDRKRLGDVEEAKQQKAREIGQRRQRHD